MEPNRIVQLIILLFSAILHEIAHGAVAEYFGDDTARDAGRITLNPVSHIDPVLTLLVPFLMVTSGSPIIFGAAKPVPVNYNNLRNFRWGVFWVSIAGVLTNLFLALFFALVLKFYPVQEGVQAIFVQIVVINVALAVINMIPIPPIDGSKVVASLFGERAIGALMRLEMSSGPLGMLPFFILIYILLLSSGFQQILGAAMGGLFRLLGLV
jgi:Zn-dependent protease